MRFFSYPALMGAFLALSGCASLGGDAGMLEQSCKPDAKTMANIDWDSARKINLRIRQDTYTPTYIRLVPGDPYRLMIENADDISHVFRATEFFKSIAVSDVRVIDGPGAGVEGGYNCSGAISIVSGATAEARFVAVRDGVYEFYDNSVLLPFAMAGTAGGFVVIEPRRPIPESPVKHLKLLERKPLVTAPEAAPTGGSLFDDEPAKQPVDAAPTVPVEELPVAPLPAKTN